MLFIKKIIINLVAIKFLNKVSQKKCISIHIFFVSLFFNYCVFKRFKRSIGRRMEEKIDNNMPWDHINDLDYDIFDVSSYYPFLCSSITIIFLVFHGFIFFPINIFLIMHLFNSIQRFSWFIYLFGFSIDKLPILLDNLKQIQKKN